MNQSIFLKILIISIAGLCTMMGLIVLIGWYTNTIEFIQVLPTFVPMQYNTALGFLLAGVGLLASFKDKETLGKIIFSIVGTIGFLTLLEYLVGIDLGIDELFMKHYITVETSHPGRMAPNTALCFLLTSIAMLLSRKKDYNKERISGIIGFLVFGLGLMSFIGYLINMKVTYAWGELTGMAVHTAMGFMIMGAGITTFRIYKELLRSTRNKLNNDFWLLAYSLSVAMIIFFIDLNLPLGMATGTLYVLIVLFAWFIKQQYVTHVLAIFATLLVILGYFYSIGGAQQWMVISSRSFSIMVIWVVAHLLYLIKKKENALMMVNKKHYQNLIQLKNKNKELAQFTYIASHDLQEPLRTVMNFTDLFEQQYKEQLDEQAKTYLSFISQASNRMSNLIKGLLDYSRIGHSKKKTNVDINEVLNELKQDLHSTIEETGTRLDIGVLPQVKGFKVELRLLFQKHLLKRILLLIKLIFTNFRL